MITIVSVLRSICLCLLLNCLLLNWPLYGQVSSRSTLHNAINTAESTQRGMIALFRMRGVAVGSKDFPELRGKDTLHAYIRSAPSEPGMNDNVACLQWYTAIAQTATSSPELEFLELMAKIGERKFGGEGQNLLPLKVYDMTDRDTSVSERFERDWRTLSLNPMALPFCTMDAFYVHKYDFDSVESVFSICTLSFMEVEDGETTMVWENLKHGAVVKVVLSDEFDNMPIQVSFHKKAPTKTPLSEGDDIGTLLYRTKTTWEKLDANSLVKDSKKKECWFPKKIELEHIPNELQPGKGYTAAEIVGIWHEAPADILSRREFPKEIAIDLELAPPGDEFSSLLTQLKYKLMRELASADLDLNRRPK